ncbi:hypothetical protein K1X12_01055 [Hyphomonas sp. WL0036]|uniref:hypothetical protein n=1 Tax=Hyphomonas sediminis TaxID=2866160 RepID=UPI001C7E7F9F|nr:hypothetical protein [Hyphomonas sediminis]MBY9065465.1 hypothetical protein [Hyphomonas sediminis]
MNEPPISLARIGSDAIRWIVEEAQRDGIELVSLAEWSKALVAHMRSGLPPALKAKIETRWPGLPYFCEPGTPHNEPDEGYIENGFAVSFPRPR